MAKYLIKPIDKIRGEITVSGAKNGVLPLMAATLLTDKVCIIEDVPQLKDVNIMIEILRVIGAKVERQGKNLKIQVPKILRSEAPYEYVSQMRSSFDVMGPLLARTGIARVPLPGGCAIGERPIDLHLKGFKALGATIEVGHGFIEARCDKLKGNKVFLDFPSVGATKNIMMAATYADGETVIENAAKEPEITDLGNFLRIIGFDVSTTETPIIRGLSDISKTKGAVHRVIPDRIEAGTFLVMGAMNDSDLLVKNVVSHHIKPVISALREAGAELIINADETIRVKSTGKLKGIDITTLPYPGFPTDMQAPFMSMMSIAEGESSIMETIFENRFMHVSELNRMNAKIKVEGHSAYIPGSAKLQGAEVKATDLRAGAALLLAALAADSDSVIHDIHHIDRGYDNLEERLQKLGIDIVRE